MSKKSVAAGKSSFDLIDSSIFFSIINIHRNAQVADLACGVGRYSIAMEKLLDEKGRIHAIDLWDEGIETLKRTIKEKGISKIKPTIADITKRIPLETESIDFCLMATILHDLSREEKDATLNEIVRILKLQGMLAIIEFKKIDNGPGPPLNIRISELEAEEKIKKYGFIKMYCGEISEFNYLITFKKIHNMSLHSDQNFPFFWFHWLIYKIECIKLGDSGSSYISKAVNGRRRSMLG